MFWWNLTLKRENIGNSREMHLPIMNSIEQVHKTNKMKVGLIYV